MAQDGILEQGRCYQVNADAIHHVQARFLAEILQAAHKFARHAFCNQLRG